MTHHVGYTLQFEQALQVVDPSISIPYWEYTIECASIVFLVWPLRATAVVGVVAVAVAVAVASMESGPGRVKSSALLPVMIHHHSATYPLLA